MIKERLKRYYLFLNKKIIDFLGFGLFLLKKNALIDLEFSFNKPTLIQKSKPEQKKNRLFIIKKEIKSACFKYLFSEYYQLGENERKKFLKNKIWGAKAGRKWHYQMARLYDSYSGLVVNRKALIKGIKYLRQADYDKIIEIGTGNGWFLDFLSKKIKGRIKFFGLDLDKKTIARANIKYRKNKRVEFVYSDIYKFSQKTTLKKAIILSCFVLEYFSFEEICNFCQFLKKEQAGYLAIVERKKVKQKINSVPVSDFSYSHRYEKIFSKLNFKKMYLEKGKREDLVDYINITAVYKV